MKIWSLPIGLVLLTGSLLGELPHLLVHIAGQGAFSDSPNQTTNDLEKAKYLPQQKSITVRSKSGIETFTPGFQFRFGADTHFACLDKGIEISEGSIFVRSRKISNSFLLQAPAVSLFLGGSGSCLINVEPNGGLKLIGLTGKMQLKSESRKISQALLPGELLFALPDNRGIGNKMTVNLSKIIEGSFLVSGFPNSKDFQNSLSRLAEAQNDLTYQEYGADVGNAKSVDSFELIPRNSKPVHEDQLSIRNSKSTTDFSSDPLSDLLGREPQRSQLSETEDAQDPASTDTIENSASSSRPFPSKVLRR